MPSEEPQEGAQVRDRVLERLAANPLSGDAHEGFDLALAKMSQAGRICLVDKLAEEVGGCRDMVLNGGPCESADVFEVNAVISQQPFRAGWRTRCG